MTLCAAGEDGRALAEKLAGVHQMCQSMILRDRNGEKMMGKCWEFVSSISFRSLSLGYFRIQNTLLVRVFGRNASALNGKWCDSRIPGIICGLDSLNLGFPWVSMDFLSPHRHSGLVLHQRVMFGGQTVLHAGEGPITEVLWRTSLIAWMNDRGANLS